MNFDDKTIEQIENRLTHGECYPTAIAMNEILSWPIGCLVVDWSDANWCMHVAHAYLIAPDGRAFDAEGFKTLEDIHADYITPRREKEVRNIRFVEYADAHEFRIAMRGYYAGIKEGQEDLVEWDRPSSYDRYMDDALPGIRQALTERLDIEERVRVEFGSAWSATA